MREREAAHFIHNRAKLMLRDMGRKSHGSMERSFMYIPSHSFITSKISRGKSFNDL